MTFQMVYSALLGGLAGGAIVCAANETIRYFIGLPSLWWLITGEPRR